MKVPRLAVALAVFGLVVLSVLVIAQGVTLLGQNWRLAWEMFPEWIAAFGGVATIGALIVAWMLYRHDVDKRLSDDEYRSATERRGQADLVTAWFINYGTATYAPVVELNLEGTNPDDIFARVPDAPKVVVSSFEIGLINASQVVIYDLVVAMVCEPRSQPLTVGLKPTEPTEWDEERDRLVLARHNVLPPGRRTARILLPNPSVGPRRLHLFFRDHQGVYWWRNDKGLLQEQETPEVGSDGHDTSVSRYKSISNALGHPASGFDTQYLRLRPLADADAT